VPLHEADCINRSGPECETECSCISFAPLAFVSSKGTDTSRMNDHTGEKKKKRLAHIESSKPQQYGGALEQNRNI